MSASAPDRSGPSARQRASRISRALADVDAPDPLRGRELYGAGDESHVGAPRRGLIGDGEPHLAGRSIAEEPHGIDVLEGRTGGHDDPQADQVLRDLGAPAGSLAAIPA